MKAHTSNFKNEIKKYGRQLDSKITYTINNEEIELGKEDLNSVTPHYGSNILKSVMKQLDVDSNVDIPVDTIINYKFGVKVNGTYEYLDFGNYIVYKSEKQEDTRSYKLTCVDKMLYAMQEYENLGVTYPITVKDYLVAICNKIGLTLGTNSFVNDTKQIQSERYLDSEGNSLGYTYRDVLDEIAQVTASTIVINNEDKLEVRYIENEQYVSKTITGTNGLYIEDAKEDNVINYSVDGKCEQNGTPTPSSPQEVKTIPSIINLYDPNYRTSNNIVHCKNGTATEENGEYTLTATGTDLYIWEVTSSGTSYTDTRGKLYEFTENSYTVTITNPLFIKNYVTYYDENKVSLGYVTKSSNSFKFNKSDKTGAKYFSIRIGYGSAVSGTTYKFKVMLEKGTVAHEYIPYGYYTRVKITGKNLFNDNIPITSNSIVSTYNDDGSISYSGQASSNWADLTTRTSCMIPAGTTLTFSIDSAKNIRVILYFDTSNTDRMIIPIGSTSVTLTTTVAHTQAKINIDGMTSGTSYSGKIYPQLEEGSTPTTYEPYKEKEVLIDMSKPNLFYGELESGDLNSSNGNNESNANRIRTKEFIEVSSSNTYYINSSVSIGRIIQYDANKNFIRYNSGSDNPLTTTSTTKYIRFSLLTTDTTTNVNIFEGTSPTPYYELCSNKDKTVKDRLLVDTNGNCSITKYIGERVFNGSESWELQWQQSGFRTSVPNIKKTTASSQPSYVMSNYYTSDTQDQVFAKNYGICNRANQSQIIIKNIDVSATVNDFKNWLSTHNTVVQYELATPETITLPNTKIPLFEGINHITFVDDLETSTTLVYNTPEISGEIIDEEYLKDINVNFGEQYGAINTVVLSRSAGADKISQSIPSDLADEDKVAIVIENNQILNGNDRATFIPEILNKLNGLTYSLNDFTSTGITYLESCDRYYVKIGETLYPCIMFNDEINVTQGLQELVHTDLPEFGETDYKKTDKTDQRINQTYLIVDKQNQTIESVVSNVSEQNSKISQITQTVDEINQKIGEITDITVSGESIVGDVELNQVNASEPITIKVRPLNGNNNISYLYPNSSLYPSSSLYPKNRKIRFIRTYQEEGTTKTENIDYEIPDDLLYYDSTHYDEFYLNYDSQTCQVTKKCKYNADGTVGLLSQEEIVPYVYPTIDLGDGNYEIQLLGYDVGYLYVTLMASNIYTTQFATKVEMNSAINQKADEISLVVNEKLDEEDFTHAEIVAKINDDTSQVQIGADKISLAGKTISMTSDNINIDSTNFKVDKDGNMVANNVTLNSGTFKGDVNTNQNCYVGNNLYVGQNQSSSYSSVKKIKFSDNVEIGKLKIGNTEALSLYSPFLNLNGKEGTNIHYEYNNTQYTNGTLSRNMFYLSCLEDGVYILGNQSGISLSQQPYWPSDKRLKQEIKDVDTSWIDELKIKEFEYIKSPNKKQIGLIAQDYIDKDYSKYFLNKNEEGYYGISYGNITNALIQYCQEMKKEINILKEEINKLKESEK